MPINKAGSVIHRLILLGDKCSIPCLVKGLGKEIGINFRNVEKWARGERLPRWAEAEKLFIYTDNQVTGQDLYEQQIQRKKANL